MSNAEQKSVERRAKPFPEAVPPAPPSLRIRKQQVVRDALSSAALELFRVHGFETVTVEQIAQAVGISRRTFFRYYGSKEDVMVEHLDQSDDRLLAELTARPLSEPPLLAIRNALIPAITNRLAETDLIRETTRLMRETSTLRRALMEHRNRLEERIAALMVQRMGTTSDDNTPMLLAFLTRALNDTAFNAWYDHETTDIAGLVDSLIERLCTLVVEMPPDFKKFKP